MTAAIQFSIATPVAVPRQPGAADWFSSVHFKDAYAIRLPSNVVASPEELARFLFAQQPLWIGGLMRIRDAVARCFGLKTSMKLAEAAEARGRVGIFGTYFISATEIVLGGDDRHLDFRIAVSLRDGRHAETPLHLTVSTLVHCHNRLGRAYILAIAPFHRLVVKSCLRRAAESGWPRTGSAADVAGASVCGRQE